MNIVTTIPIPVPVPSIRTFPLLSKVDREVLIFLPPKKKTLLDLRPLVLVYARINLAEARHYAFIMSITKRTLPARTLNVLYVVEMGKFIFGLCLRADISKCG